MNAQAGMARRSNPLEADSALYETFATLNPAPDRVLAFANKYGWLGKAETCIVPGKRTSNGFFAESLSLWKEEIRDAALARWLIHRVIDNDLATGEKKSADRIAIDRQELKQAIQWSRDAVGLSANVQGSRVSFGSKVPDGGYRVDLAIAKDHHLRTELFQGWKMGGENPLQPARYALIEIMNGKLRDSSPRLFFDNSGEFQGRIVPRDLVALIWLQMYRLLAGQTRVRQCVVCREWMDITNCRSTKRMHDHCSKSERMRKYNSLKQQKPNEQKTRSKLRLDF
jgi:hypothetical protein